MNVNAPLTLVSHALCPYVQRAVIALKEKGLDFKRIDIDLANKPAWFLELSPLGKTPVLIVEREDEDLAIFESAVICEYLDEVYGLPLHPTDALLRAQHRAWIEFASASLSSVWQLYTAPDVDLFEQHRRQLVTKMQQLEVALSSKGVNEGPWFAGAAFSLVDAAFAPLFRYFDVIDPIVDLRLFRDTPRLDSWRKALSERSSVRAAVSVDYRRQLFAFLSKQNSYLGEQARALLTDKVC